MGFEMGFSFHHNKWQSNFYQLPPIGSHLINVESLLKNVNPMIVPSIDVKVSSETEKPVNLEQRKFDRTNRLDGRKQWVDEICDIKLQCKEPEQAELVGIGKIIDLAKELLYSGIPEQVLELYTAYFDNVIRPKMKVDNINKSILPVIPNQKLILTRE